MNILVSILMSFLLFTGCSIKENDLSISTQKKSLKLTNYKKSSTKIVEEDEVVYFSKARDIAIQNAEKSFTKVQKEVSEFVEFLEIAPQFEDKVHMIQVKSMFNQSQKDWLAYRYTTCQCETFLRAYPQRSNLSVQTLNNCYENLDKERSNYINDIMKSFL